MTFDALAALRTAGHPVDMLTAAQQRVLAELDPAEVHVLNTVKLRLDAAGPEVAGQDMKIF